jgi:hypothetical protein
LPHIVFSFGSRSEGEAEKDNEAKAMLKIQSLQAKVAISFSFIHRKNFSVRFLKGFI